MSGYCLTYTLMIHHIEAKYGEPSTYSFIIMNHANPFEEDCLNESMLINTCIG